MRKVGIKERSDQGKMLIIIMERYAIKIMKTLFHKEDLEETKGSTKNNIDLVKLDQKTVLTVLLVVLLTKCNVI